jgi:hypothetical protein
MFEDLDSFYYRILDILDGNLVNFISIFFIISTAILVYLELFNLILLASYIILSWIGFIYINRFLDLEVKGSNLYNDIENLPLYFAGTFIISIYTVYRLNIRPLHYFLSISIMYLLLYLLINKYGSNIREKSNYILILIGALFLNIIWSQNLKYYYFFGHGDLFHHVYYIKTIMTNKNTGAISGIYSNYTIFHILCTTLLTIIKYDIPLIIKGMI